MTLRLAALALFALLPVAASAQSEAAEVRAAVYRLFDGMRDGDSTAVRAHFHPNATLYSVFATPEGERRVAATPIDRFVEAVGTPREEVWDERVGEIEVRIDGDLATAWMPYAFYLGHTFSHCGVNAFHLARTEEGWRTIHITDTRRTDDCDPSVVTR